MRRRLFTILAGGSLVLWLAVSALWLRSYWASDRVSWDQGEGVVTVGASRGRLWVRHLHPVPHRDHGLHYHRDEPETIETARPSWADEHFSTPGFTFSSGRFWWAGTDVSEAVVDFWLLATLLAVPPLLWLGTRWRQRRLMRVEGFRVVVGGGEAGSPAGARATDDGRG